MASKQRKIKSDVWVILAVIAIVIFAFIADWWKEHAVIGWIILGVVLVATGYIVYRYASVRGWIGRQVKDTVKKAVFEKVASEREPLSQREREEVLKRAQNRCENERCNYQGKPHIHHIDGNNQNNRLGNLIALSPNCHQKAHDGILTESQLINWVRRDYKRLQTRRAKR
jgi:5-methylcytosine-specific restriction endonuclease McrA